MTSAAFTPLSSAPVPSAQLSRCAPSTTTSSGFSLPRISATTFCASKVGPMRFTMSIRTRTSLRAASQASRSACSRETSATGTVPGVRPKTIGCW